MGTVPAHKALGQGTRPWSASPPTPGAAGDPPPTYPVDDLIRPGIAGRDVGVWWIEQERIKLRDQFINLSLVEGC